MNLTHDNPATNEEIVLLELTVSMPARDDRKLQGSAVALRTDDQEDPVEVAICLATTIGQLERLAGIETHKDRAEFWLAFAPLRNMALNAGKAELKRIIRNKRGGNMSR